MLPSGAATRSVDVYGNSRLTGDVPSPFRIRFFGDYYCDCSLTATVIFASRDNDVSDSLTIQGLHDLVSNNETGSVTSASARFADYIGGAFSFNAAEGLLTVNPRAW